MCKINADPANGRRMKMRPPSQPEEKAEGILRHRAPNGGGFLGTVIESYLLGLTEQGLHHGR